MLGFILSKMQMLIFATGIFIIAVLFYGFVSGIEVNKAADSILISSKAVIDAQVNSDSPLSSFKLSNIPEKIYYGFNNSSNLSYDMNFSYKEMNDAGSGKDYNLLSLSISEHKKPTILASRSIPVRGAIVLIDPGFIPDSPLNNYYGKEEISLYPRAAMKGGSAPPNSFVALKQIDSTGSVLIYIIPCSSYIEGSCSRGIVKTGCYLLSKSSPSFNTPILSAFDVPMDTNKMTENQTRGYDWSDCQEIFGGDYR